MKNGLKAALCSSLALYACGTTSHEDKQPDIIYILADDLGYGDLSCYGQSRFQTPNIDRLSNDGMLFTQHYSGCTVSAPSRSSLFTGLHTGHTPIRGNKEWQPEGQWPLPASSVTIPEMLKSQGYITGVFGKWGLGYPGSEGDPSSQGVDEFLGYNCQRLAHNYYPDHLWYNREKILLHENDSSRKGAYSAELIHKAALQFIEKNRKKPFILFYTTTIPHAELFAKEEYHKRFAGKLIPEKSFSGVDSGQTFRLGGYGSQPEAHAAFAGMVTQLDDYVGEIIQKLKELGLEKNTIIMFASDNGPHLEGGADPDYFNSNGVFRGYKRDMYEGGIRTAFIVKWPAKVKAGARTDHVSAFWDVMPTIAEITGASCPESDGISFVPTLLGKKNQKQHEFLYWEFHEQGGKQAVRTGNWKAVRLNADNTDAQTELYDLSNDPGEKINVSASHPDVMMKIDQIMTEAHSKSDIFQFAYEKQ
ncbi:MAG TPA: arylsulfatase [Bacteroidales bacterium]|nr:arylsulfatase [Bacteroidales bacterium]